MGCRDPDALRILAATNLSLRGRHGALDRLVATSELVDAAEASGDRALFLAARTWRVVPLLELGESAAVAVEVEAIRKLSARAGEPAWARCGQLLGVASGLFGTPRASAEPLGAIHQALGQVLCEAPPSPGDPAAVGVLADLVSAIDDCGAGELAAPLAWHWMEGVPASRIDPFQSSLALGILSLCAGQREAAGRHLGSALDHAAHVGPRLLALTRHGVASLLAPDAPAYAAALLQSAGDAYARLGMGDARAHAAALAAKLEGGDAHPQPGPPRLRREGEYWSLAYGGREVHLRDSKGLRDLSYLLSHPGRWVGALDLMHAEAPTDGGPSGGARPLDQASAEGLGLSAPMRLERSDPRALREYALAARELRGDLEKASAAADLGRMAFLREQLELLEQELERHGRSADAGLPVERARKAVSNRIRREIRAVGRHHPALGRHLAESVRTGSCCAYLPPSGTAWDVQDVGRTRGRPPATRSTQDATDAPRSM